jgi:hypothetical protein
VACLTHRRGTPPGSLSGAIVRAIGLTDHQILSIQLCDPYSGASWHGAHLRDLRTTLEHLAEGIRQQGRVFVCAQSHRREMADWMQPQLEAYLLRSEKYLTLCEVVGLIDETLAANGTLVFDGD